MLPLSKLMQMKNHNLIRINNKLEQTEKHKNDFKMRFYTYFNNSKNAFV